MFLYLVTVTWPGWPLPRYQQLVFSRRFSSEKSPTITVASFLSSDHRPHRVCTTFCRLYSFTCTRQYRLYSVYGELSGHGLESLLKPETFSSNFFFGTVRFFHFFPALSDFFPIFLPSKGPRVPPSSSFDILQRSKGPKARTVSTFMYFGTRRLFKILNF